MITETQLEHLLDALRKQMEYETKCDEAYKVIFPTSYPPMAENYTRDALCDAIDMLLGFYGEDNFTEWWVYDTKMGREHAWVELDHWRYPLTNAREIIAYAEAYNKEQR